MPAEVRPFLMFEGQAEEAMTFYTAQFSDGAVEDIVRYGPGEMGKAGTVKTARFVVGGQAVLCIDSPAAHAFTFTPSFSLFVTCASGDEFERLFGALSQGGAVMMPPDAYGFSTRFTWFSDRFGVSWQLNLP